ncbi:MAG: hypothetical protein AAFO77_11485 [Pseudomonadota bacterium]
MQRIAHIVIALGVAVSPAYAQRTAIFSEAGSELPTGTVMPAFDPVITGSTGMNAPQSPAPMNYEECDADCQAKKLGITFDE